MMIFKRNEAGEERRAADGDRSALSSRLAMLVILPSISKRNAVSGESHEPTKAK
jgi:hypothetical protein